MAGPETENAGVEGVSSGETKLSAAAERLDGNEYEETISGRFAKSKDQTQVVTEEYLKSSKGAEEVDFGKLKDDLKASAGDAIAEGDFTTALKKLEALRDAKSNIATYTKNDTLIRDARNASDSRVLSSEAFEMQYLNAVRAAMDVIDKDTDLKGVGADEKTALKNAIKEQVVGAVSRIRSTEGEEQKEYGNNLKTEIDQLIHTLNDCGIEKADKKLNIAKDFQNFKDTHYNMVTITSSMGEAIIESETAFKELTAAQKQEFQDIKNNKDTLPAWFNAMSSLEQALLRDNIDKIIAGDIIPTQLTQLNLMKNAFQKDSGVFRDGKIEVTSSSKHGGCLSSLSKDKKAREGVTGQMIDQLQSWCGENIKPHINTLNSGKIGFLKNFLNKKDADIVKLTKKAAKQKEILFTNSSFNSLRFMGSNDSGGAKNLLNEVAKTQAIKEHKEIRSYLKPGIFGGGSFEKANKKIDALLKSESIKPEEAKLLKAAIELRQAVNKSNISFKPSAVLFNFAAIKIKPIREAFGYKKNASRDVSNKLNELTDSINKLPKESKFKDLEKTETYTACKSGKDRTALAEHDKTVHSTVKPLADKILSHIQNAKQETTIDTQLSDIAEDFQKIQAESNKKIENAVSSVIGNEKSSETKSITSSIQEKFRLGQKIEDAIFEVLKEQRSKDVLKSGHSASQAGSISAGGGGVGNFGTKGENKHGVESKAEEAIIEYSSKSNSIEDHESERNADYEKAVSVAVNAVKAKRAEAMSKAQGGVVVKNQENNIDSLQENNIDSLQENPMLQKSQGKEQGHHPTPKDVAAARDIEHEMLQKGKAQQDMHAEIKAFKAESLSNVEDSAIRASNASQKSGGMGVG